MTATIDENGNVTSGAWGDVRSFYPLSDLVWVKVENYTDHSQGLPSPTGKNNGSYGSGRNGLELIVHKDDVAVWPTIFVPIEGKKVESIGTPVPSSAEVKLDPPEKILEKLGQEDGEADFTQLNGVGPAGATKLKDASIVTFTQFAALEPEQLSEILGQTVDADKANELIAAAAEKVNES